MAESQQPGVNTNSFSKGMMRDYNESFVGEGMYTHARNAVNNSHDGQVGIIGNEPSNLFCVKLPYTLIGCVHLYDDKWVVFTTDNTNSEIGLFDESDCTYDKIVNAPCLNFKTTNLITGVSRTRFDCETLVYWDDGLNPTRTLNIDEVPWVENCVVVNDCEVCTPTTQLNCEAIRLAPLIKHPCISIRRGEVSGTLPNGSYQACIAYLIDGTKITDYIALSDVQGLFTHENVSSSLEITISDIDERFDEFDLVILSNINAQTVAKKIGTYSTGQGVIYVDRWDTEFITVSLSDIVLRTEPIEKSDALYSVGQYLLRTGVYSKFKFNYQPLANQIRVNWTAVQYPADYYIKSNHNTGYMRDEVYPFFIRFIYNTGEYSESYHIPGRAPLPSDTQAVASGGDNIDTISRPYWNVYNTGSVTNTTQSNLADGGRIIARGEMAYWESTERYPNNMPNIWGNLCGKPIRHHKMPDETRSPLLSTFNNNGNNIVLLGVEISNIPTPLDQDGNPITSIVGYQILRGSREGNKSIIAKGLINNMRSYNIPNIPNTQGLFQNYPYNDLREDPYLTSDQQDGDDGDDFKPLLRGYKKDYFSFHSPETTFNNPFLNAAELKVYSLYSGTMNGYFEDPYKHPKDKQITNIAGGLILFLSGVMANAQSVSAIAGGFDVTLGANTDVIKNQIGASNVIGEGTLGLIGDAAAIPAAAANILVATSFYGIPSITGLNAILSALGINILNPISNLFPGLISIQQQLYRIFRQILPKRQFARQFNSHGFYNQTIQNKVGNIRRKLLNSIYVSPSIQQFPTTPLATTSYQINNVNRSRVVVVQTQGDILDPRDVNGTQREEQTRYIISQEGQINKELYSYYASLKLSIPSQYGQLQSIKQLVVSTCYSKLTPTLNLRFSTPVLFGGDTYINRFTEKNTMFFFTSWLMGEPDLTEFDYTKYVNIPYPTYWINTEYNGTAVTSSSIIPSNFRSLDFQKNEFVPISLKRGAFYLFNSGVRDFFVESEVNVAYRDWEEPIPKQHYDPYRFTDLSLMFRSDIIQNGNFYKYDYSLSISKLVGSSITWGNLLPRNYDPQDAAECFTYRPERVIYSLPQNDESRRDTWRVFLVNNYEDFSSKVSSIKPINKTGALFMLKNESPIQFTGTEELRLDNNTNTKVTIGDGGLFNQPLQNVVNVDTSYEYGSNQGRYCAINTTYGLFWVSQNQGKIFQFQGGLNDITNGGMKWWFAKYFPSQLLAMYPDYPYYDNPVVGVGVQMIYDNTNEIIYVTKKDYKPKFTDSSTLQLIDGQFYLPNSNTPIPFTNKDYFQEANVTVSYDPKLKIWVSFHDWIPTFVIPGRSHFMSVNGDSIWKHNITCTSYCNFYGVEYPFEVEFVSTTGQQVASMRSLEYMLEVYNYYNDCKDKFHVLDQNFDQAVIYNSEQISGVLELSLKSKSNPLQMLTYPQIGTNSIKIQFSKEENKYRFNQFWDITKDRGEFSGANLPMFITEPNGYQFAINPAYVDYNKPPLQRKKFRHYVNTIFLRKHVSGKNKFLFKMSNEKLLQSYR
jgi:hypothetical protein